jgi:hypothetical protein
MDFESYPTLKLEMVNSFGANFVQKDKRKLVKSLSFLDTGMDQDYIIYPVGRHIGIRLVGKNNMNFITMGDHVKEITGLTLSNVNPKNNKRFLFVHQTRTTDWHAWVEIYEFSKNFKQPKVLKSLNLSEWMYGHNLK